VSAAVVDVIAGSDPQLSRRWQRPSGSVLAWVLAEFAPVLGDAEVLHVDAESDSLRVNDGRRWVPVGAVRVYVNDPDRASSTAAGLDLGGAGTDVRGGWTWLSWTGWVPGAGPDFPVSVTLVAAAAAAAAAAAGAPVSR